MKHRTSKHKKRGGKAAGSIAVAAKAKAVAIGKAPKNSDSDGNEIIENDEKTNETSTLVHVEVNNDDEDDNEEEKSEDDVDGDNSASIQLSASKTKPVSHRTKPMTRLTAPHSKEVGNGLTELIPGYIAPLKLDTSHLLASSKVSLTELRRKAERTDASTKNFVVAPSASSNKSSLMKTSFLPTTYAQYSFKLGQKRAPDLSAGTGWFGMMSSEVTDDVKADIAVIRNRNYLDPKRFYKKADKIGKHVQVGTVIEGSAEYYSSRLTKKERRSNLVQEIMADPESSNYVKRKSTKLQQQRQAATAHFHKKKRKVTKLAKRGY